MKFVIIHGSNGTPDSNWFQYLKKEIEKKGHEVILPAFPNSPEQSLTNWMKVFTPYLSKIDSNTVFIGHSLGPSFILSVLEKVNVKVKACFFVAGFTGPLGIDLDAINYTFTEKEFNWNKIKQNCSKFICYASTNDQYVPLTKVEELCKQVSGELIIINNAGHFRASDGYIEFKQLLDKINTLKNF